VYFLVGFIVKLDDIGLAMTKMKNTLAKNAGQVLLNSAPFMMRSLTFIGTLAMFSVGGEIIAHQFHQAEEMLKSISSSIPNSYLVFTVIFGLLLGLATVPLAHLSQKLLKKKQA